MELFTTFLILCMSALRSINGHLADPAIFSVLSYGAVGDGITDDSNAFLAAWAAACRAVVDTPVLRIPEGKTFLLSSLRFQGPCKSSNINVYVNGNIVAPSKIEAWNNQKNWIVFSNVNGLIVNGSGIIDGKGSVWWDHYNQLSDSYKMNNERPTAMEFVHCNNAELSGLTYINSPRGHITIWGCTGFTISNLHITAPATSPNTDGINIGQSSNVQIHNCIIGTGDDCIAVSGGSTYINITGIACGPGHGISIGSLGEDGGTAMVEEVSVRNCSFNGTMNGARIKSWQGGSGYAKHITFQDMTLIGAENPIFIDQYYCDSIPKCKNHTSAVQVSDISYNRIYGTSITDEAIRLSCSETVGCTNIILKNINIISAYPNHIVSASCLNAHGSSIASTPGVNCLLP